MKRMIAGIERAIGQLLVAVAIGSYTVLTTMIFFMVIARYVFQWSIIGPDEIALIAAMWLYMSGAMIASRTNDHIVVDFLPEMLKGTRWQEPHRIATGALILVACGFFLHIGWELFSVSLQRPQRTPGLRLSQLWATSALMVASVGCFAYTLKSLIAGDRFYQPQIKD